MLLQGILLLVAVGLLYAARGHGVLSPLRMFLYGWVLVLGTTVSGMIIYENTFAIRTFVMVLATVALFTCGVYLANVAAKSHSGRPALSEDIPFGHSRDRSDRISLVALCVVASVGSFLVLLDLASGGLAFLANFSTESGQARNEYWSDNASGPADSTPLQSLKFYGTVAALAVAVLLPYAVRYKRRLLRLACVLAAVAVVLNSLLSSARFSIGVLAICLLVSATLVYGGDSLRKVFTVRRVILGVAVSVYFFIIFPTQRNAELVLGVDRYLSFAGDAHISDWVKSAATFPGLGWLEVFAYSTGYFSTSLDKLNYFASETDSFSWYTLGVYNLPQFSSYISAIDGDLTTWHEIRRNIAAIMWSEGWGRNPWSTGIRDIGIDFGVFAFPAMVLFGYVAQTVYLRALSSRSYIGLIAASYVSTACFIFAFISPFQIRILGTGFFVIGFIAILRAMISNGPKQRASLGSL